MTDGNAGSTRLIEVLMPMEQASILSPREKNVRSGGYISTFHVWPARRPLASAGPRERPSPLPTDSSASARAVLTGFLPVIICPHTTGCQPCQFPSVPSLRSCQRRQAATLVLVTRHLGPSGYA